MTGSFPLVEEGQEEGVFGRSPAHGPLTLTLSPCGRGNPKEPSFSTKLLHRTGHPVNFELVRALNALFPCSPPIVGGGELQREPDGR